MRFSKISRLATEKIGVKTLILEIFSPKLLAIFTQNQGDQMSW
jgi:hypothetical protein